MSPLGSLTVRLSLASTCARPNHPSATGLTVAVCRDLDSNTNSWPR